MMLVSSMSTRSPAQRRISAVWISAVASACAMALLLACLLGTTLATAAPAISGTQAVQSESSRPGASATLQQCLTTGTQTERSATFAGEMSAIPGSARMEMRIDVLERMPDDLAYHMVTAPGLGVWRSSAPGVKAYTYLKQVTNLSAPAFYRGEVRFRWLNAKGHLLKVAVLRTRRCEQPAPAPAETETSLTGSGNPAGTG
jgi:hypothetical protein